MPVKVTVFLMLAGILMSSCGHRADMPRESDSEGARTKKDDKMGLADGPGATETITFIANRASVSAMPPYRDRVVLTKDNRCTVTLGPIHGLYGVLVNFADLNPESVEVVENPGFVRVRATNAELVIKSVQMPSSISRENHQNELKGTFESSWGESSTPPLQSREIAHALIEKRRIPLERPATDKLEFSVRTKEDLPKVREALLHLIRKCGGKRDLF